MPQINLMSSSVQRIDTLDRNDAFKKGQQHSNFTVDRSAQRDVTDEDGRQLPPLVGN